MPYDQIGANQGPSWANHNLFDLKFASSETMSWTPQDCAATTPHCVLLLVLRRVETVVYFRRMARITPPQRLATTRAGLLLHYNAEKQSIALDWSHGFSYNKPLSETRTCRDARLVLYMRL